MLPERAGSLSVEQILPVPQELFLGHRGTDGSLSEGFKRGGKESIRIVPVRVAHDGGRVAKELHVVADHPAPGAPIRLHTRHVPLRQGHCLHVLAAHVDLVPGLHHVDKVREHRLAEITQLVIGQGLVQIGGELVQPLGNGLAVQAVFGFPLGIHQHGVLGRIPGAKPR